MTVQVHELAALAPRLAPHNAFMMSVPVRQSGSSATLDSLGLAREYERFAGALILDTCLDPDSQKRCGCTGRTNDWEVCARIARASSLPVMLAGGLNEHNVGDAIRQVRPRAVDACTALEREDQSKDLRKCEAFLAAAYAAA